MNSENDRRESFGGVDQTIPAAGAALDCGPTPAFGRVFTPGMLVAEWREATSALRDAGTSTAARPAVDSATGGWGRARLVPQGEIGVHPGAVVFHYGQAIFEGMKAYRQPDGRLAIFRPREHAERFIRSAERMAMPPIPPDLFIAYLTRFVEHQGAALPDHPGMALYLRPLMIGVEPGLGIRAATEYLLVIMGCPVAPYFQRTVEGGLRVQVSDEYVRAAPGGTGAVKAAGNYGRGLRALRDAKAAGYDQVIWLDARERSWVEEMEGMNFFYVRRGALLTPSASETILPGITRASLLTLARDEGIEAREEPIRVETLMDGIASGEVTEAFAAGTAVVVAPIGDLLWRDRSARLPQEHPIATRVHATLSAYQSGRVPDRYEWLTPVSRARSE
jgi:branched-chain amino acid aminotransferase